MSLFFDIFHRRPELSDFGLLVSIRKKKDSFGFMGMCASPRYDTSGNMVFCKHDHIPRYWLHHDCAVGWTCSDGGIGARRIVFIVHVVLLHDGCEGGIDS